MTASDSPQLLVYFLILVALVKPLGDYMAGVLSRPSQPMAWQVYAAAFLTFNFLGLVAVYALLRLQPLPPLEPATVPGH